MLLRSRAPIMIARLAITWARARAPLAGRNDQRDKCGQGEQPDGNAEDRAHGGSSKHRQRKGRRSAASDRHSCGPERPQAGMSARVAVAGPGHDQARRQAATCSALSASSERASAITSLTLGSAIRL